MTELENFLYSLLGKRKRRILILTRWHTTKCIFGDTFEEVTFNFFRCILYEPLAISLHKTHLKLFNVNGLNIPYEWLLPHERQYVLHLFVNRFEYFKQKEFYLNGGFTLKFLRGTLSKQYRREILRDFVWMCQTKDSIGSVIFLRVCQRLLAKPKVCDRFIHELHEALQGRAKMSEILCIYG